MRLDPRIRRSAADLVNTMREEDLANVLYKLADERYSRRIARNIAEARRVSPITTTDRLAELVRAAIPVRHGPPERIDPATRTFMALRMAVNEEVGNLSRLLEQAPKFLKPGGRLLFDTINRTVLSSFIFVVLGEVVLRIGPRGAHDPAKFIKPSELHAKLLQSGLAPGPMAGFGPTGLNRLFDVTFARLPTMSLMYMGSAEKMYSPISPERAYRRSRTKIPPLTWQSEYAAVAPVAARRLAFQTDAQQQVRLDAKPTSNDGG